MMLFSTRLGWSVLGVVGLDLDSCWAGLRALDRRAEIGLLLDLSVGSECGTPLQKQEIRWVGGGFARGRSNA